MIEYKLAEQSLPVMKANVQSMKAAFDGGSGQGLDDLLDYVKAQKNNQNLSAVVNAAFDDIVVKINAITPPYATATGSQTQQLKDLYTALKTLIAYFKVDVANNLGVAITFTDTDGD
jgi:predicted lipoprotein